MTALSNPAFWTLGKVRAFLSDAIFSRESGPFPEMSRLSPRNLKYMRVLPNGELVQRIVAQLPWGHNANLGNDLRSRIAASVRCFSTGSEG